MAIYQKITLYSRSVSETQIVNAVQNDTDRVLVAFLADFTLQEGMTGKLSFVRSDRSHYEVNAVLNPEANTATAELDQALTQSGVTQAQLKIYTSGNIGSSFTFYIKVQPDVNGEPKEQEGWTIPELAERIEDAENSITEVEQRVSETEEAISGISEDISGLSTVVNDIDERVTEIESEIPGLATNAEVQEAIDNAIAGITGIDFQVVDSLPTTGVKGVIYLVSNSGSDGNSYDEYIWIDGDPAGHFEKIGTTDIDLSAYWTMETGNPNSLEALTDEEINEILV